MALRRWDLMMKYPQVVEFDRLTMDSIWTFDFFELPVHCVIPSRRVNVMADLTDITTG